VRDKLFSRELIKISMLYTVAEGLMVYLMGICWNSSVRKFRSAVLN
jgi:hypothetical protein